MTTEKTLELVRAYYDSWKGGADHFDEARLRSVLHPRLQFESPASKRDDLEETLPGIQRFGKTVRAHRMLQMFASGNEAAAIYDCDLTAPVDSLRLAEFFRVEGDRITSIRLIFDASAYKAKT